jgi:hypothetical protein
MLKLNLGSGPKLLPGYINVDKFGSPDLLCDLEMFPWPWPDDAVEEVLLTHVLEHLGATPALFLGIMCELYRVCRDGALLRITVPHFRHEFLYSDPTHVRAITPLTISLFSQEQNRYWKKVGGSNSLLAFYLGVDFELLQTRYRPSADWFKLHPGPQVDTEFLLSQAALYNNLIDQISMDVRVIKPPGKNLREEPPATPSHGPASPSQTPDTTVT